MKHPLYTLLVIACAWTIQSYAQTPYDSFSPETSRLMLGIEANSSVDTINRSLTANAMPATDNIRKWLSVDPLADKYPNISPYAYCGWNPINAIDPDGRDSIYFYDQNQRPNDRGKAGETYTAKVVVVQNDQVVGEYRGSTYPNSKSNKDNSTEYNTILEGTFLFNNASGHDGGTKQGLNIIDENGNRQNIGISPDGNEVTMDYTNIHSGKSDNGNYNSRGSHGCLTIHPDDAVSFFSNFSWTNDVQTIGNSIGRIFISRQDKK